MDLAGLAVYLVVLWGSSLVVRGAFAALISSDMVDVWRSTLVGSTLCVGAAAVLWNRRRRVAALLAVGPGLTAVVTLLLSPRGAFGLLCLGVVPFACAAASAANRLPTNRDRALVLWVFAASSVLGAVGTGFLALTASMTVVVCALLGPDPERFAVSSLHVAVPDDISGL